MNMKDYLFGAAVGLLLAVLLYYAFLGGTP